MNDRPTPETDAAWNMWLAGGRAGHLRDISAKLERERDELREEVERLKAEYEIYAGWSKWKAGVWLITHPDSGPSAEWIADDIESFKADNARLDWLDRPDTQKFMFGDWIGGGGTLRDAIDAAMKGDA